MKFKGCAHGFGGAIKKINGKFTGAPGIVYASLKIMEDSIFVIWKSRAGLFWPSRVGEF